MGIFLMALGTFRISQVQSNAAYGVCQLLRVEHGLASGHEYQSYLGHERWDLCAVSAFASKPRRVSSDLSAFASKPRIESAMSRWAASCYDVSNLLRRCTEKCCGLCGLFVLGAVHVKRYCRLLHVARGHIRY